MIYSTSGQLVVNTCFKKWSTPDKCDVTIRLSSTCSSNRTGVCLIQCKSMFTKKPVEFFISQAEVLRSLRAISSQQHALVANIVLRAF